MFESASFDIKKSSYIKVHTHKSFNGRKVMLVQNNNVHTCVLCKGNHAIYSCSKFFASSVKEHTNIAKSTKLPVNCLKPGHFTNNCTAGSCKKGVNESNACLHNTSTSTVLLATAIVQMRDSNYKLVECKILFRALSLILSRQIY